MSWLSLAPDDVPASKPEPVTVVLSFDLSGSMSGGPLEEAKKAAKKLVDNLDMSGSSVAVVGFADNVKVYCEPTQNAKIAYKAIDSMSIGDVGGGNSTHPFVSVKDMLEKNKTKKFLIVLADGVWSYQDEAIRRANDCKKADIETIAIGFGGADKKFLQAIASTDENALMTSLESLSQSFSNIAQTITERSTGKGMRFFG
jgi:molecular chaperone DnaK